MVHENDTKFAAAQLNRVVRALRKAGVEVKRPEKANSYKVDFLLDGIPSIMRIEQPGHWPVEGAPFRLRFGRRHGGQVLVPQRKDGLHVASIVPRIQAFIAEEKKRLADNAERDRVIEINRNIAKKLHKKLRIDEASKMGISGAHNVHGEGLVRFHVSLDAITPKQAELAVQALRKALPEKLLSHVGKDLE